MVKTTFVLLHPMLFLFFLSHFQCNKPNFPTNRQITTQQCCLPFSHRQRKKPQNFCNKIHFLTNIKLQQIPKQRTKNQTMKREVQINYNPIVLSSFLTLPFPNQQERSNQNLVVLSSVFSSVKQKNRKTFATKFIFSPI